MPAILKIGPYRFLFFSNEGSEPAHIHVKAAENEAKFWLEPVQLAANYGFNGRQLTEILGLVEEHCNEFLEAWDEYFSK
jgi:hypothetical protein